MKRPNIDARKYPKITSRPLVIPNKFYTTGYKERFYPIYALMPSDGSSNVEQREKSYWYGRQGQRSNAGIKEDEESKKKTEGYNPLSSYNSLLRNSSDSAVGALSALAKIAYAKEKLEKEKDKTRIKQKEQLEELLELERRGKITQYWALKVEQEGKDITDVPEEYQEDVKFIIQMMHDNDFFREQLTKNNFNLITSLIPFSKRSKKDDSKKDDDDDDDDDNEGVAETLKTKIVGETGNDEPNVDTGIASPIKDDDVVLDSDDERNIVETTSILNSLSPSTVEGLEKALGKEYVQRTYGVGGRSAETTLRPDHSGSAIQIEPASLPPRNPDETAATNISLEIGPGTIQLDTRELNPRQPTAHPVAPYNPASSSIDPTKQSNVTIPNVSDEVIPNVSDEIFPNVSDEVIPNSPTISSEAGSPPTKKNESSRGKTVRGDESSEINLRNNPRKPDKYSPSQETSKVFHSPPGTAEYSSEERYPPPSTPLQSGKSRQRPKQQQQQQTTRRTTTTTKQEQQQQKLWRY